LWDLQNDLAVEPQVLPGDDGWLWSVTFSPDSYWLSAGFDDGTVRLWDLLARQAGEVTAQADVLRGHGGPVRSLAWSPDGRWLATGSVDRTARLWPVSANLETDLQTGDAADAAQVLSGHEAGVTSVAFSPEGRWLASGSDDGTARLWDLSSLPSLSQGGGTDEAQLTGDPNLEPFVLTGHEGRVTSVAFSPDGRWLATGSWDQTIGLWELSTVPDAGVPEGIRVNGPRMLGGHEGPVTSVAFSPDGRWLASGGGGWEDTARLWDLSTLPAPSGTEAPGSVVEPQVRLLRGHTSAISSVAFSPDGRWLVTGSLDDTARVWDLLALVSEDANLAADPVVLHGHGDNVTAVAFSPDGRWLGTGSLDTTVRLWRMSLDELAAEACRIAGRNLTQQEWAQYLRGEEYDRTCESLPVHPSVIDTERNES
jgi:WD40 repeat protein